MKTQKWLTLLLLMLLAQVQGIAQEKTESTYVIRNVTVISPERDKPVIGTRDVFIKQGKIDTIKKSTKRRPRTKDTEIDGTGKFLMPGLADMHAHIPAEDAERYLLVNLLAGVTTLRSMRGDTSHITLKEKIATGKLTGPDLFISPPPFSARTNIKEHELLGVIAAYKASGYDLLKVLSVPDSSYFEKLMQAANAHNMMVAGHAPGQVKVSRVIETGYSSIEHLQGLIQVYQHDSTALAPLLASLKQNNTYNCPTLDWYFITTGQFSLDELKARKGLEYVDVSLVEKWIAQAESKTQQQSQLNQDSLSQKQEQMTKDIQAKMRLVKKLHEANAPLLLSPDASASFAVPGFNVYEEMNHYSKAGLSNQAILKIATYNPSAYMGQQKQWGTIAPGMKANLLLLSENPLHSIENVQHIEAVITHGKYLTIQDLVNRINNLSSSKPVSKKDAID